jgi:hypothetical protein
MLPNKVGNVWLWHCLSYLALWLVIFGSVSFGPTTALYKIFELATVVSAVVYGPIVVVHFVARTYRANLKKSRQNQRADTAQ